MSEILIVDDERAVRKALASALRAEGYAVREARGGEEALALFDAKRPSLVLLDVMMPGMNGFAVCGEIRRRDPAVPVVFLTAKGGDASELRGFGLGCDDYVAKSASEEVLLARIRRALERAARTPSAPGGDASATLAFGGVRVDLKGCLVTREDGSTAELTRTEADLLGVLASHRGRRLTTEELVAELRGAGFVCEDSLVYTHMHRLRGKLGPAGDLITCSRRAGYALG